VKAVVSRPSTQQRDGAGKNLASRGKTPEPSPPCGIAVYSGQEYMRSSIPINTPLQRMGVNLRTCTKTKKTDSPCLQPEGLADGSRWSFEGKGGTTTGNCRVARMHPGGVPETSATRQRRNGSGTPAGVQPTSVSLPGGRAPFPPRPPATICQPFGLDEVAAHPCCYPKVDAHALKRGVNENRHAARCLRVARRAAARSPRGPTH
jgi:hypothetical protein